MAQRMPLLTALALICFIIPARAQVTASDSLLYYLTCDGLPAADSSVEARPNATTMGSPSVVAGKVGKAFRVNSAVDTDAFNAGTWQIADPVSVTAWFQIDDANANNYMKILSTKAVYNDATGFEVQYNPMDKNFTLLSGGDSPFATAGFLTINANTWYHIAMVASGTTATIYLDGVNVTSTSVINAVLANPMKAVIVGASATPTALNTGGVWHGVLDEVRVYGIALTGAQVQSIITEATTTTTTAASSASSSTLSTSTTSSSSTSSTATSSAVSTTRAATSSISPLGTGAALNVVPLAVLLLVIMLVLIQ